MNVLIVADRVNGKAYTDIINKLKNTKTIGVINTVSQTLVTEIGTRYTPNAIIIDTAVDYNNLFAADNRTDRQYIQLHQNSSIGQKQTRAEYSRLLL